MTKAMMLCTAALVVSVGAASGQTTPFQIGPTAGVALTTFVGDDVEDAEYRTSPYFGASLVYQPAASAIGFETGLLYVPKGAKGSDEEGTGTIKLTYIEVPLLLRYGFNLEGSNIRPVVMLGGSVGINTGCELEGSAGGVSVTIDCDDPLLEGELEVKTIDFGASAGVGVEIPVGMRGILEPSVRYTRGLTNIPDSDEEGSLKNSAFQIGVSFRFAL